MKSKKRHIALIAAAVMLLTVVPALAAEPAAAAGKEIKLARVKLTNHAAGSRSVKNTWKKVKGADGYEIYRSARLKGKYKKVKTIKKAKQVSWTNKKLKKGKSYYYKVRAYRMNHGEKEYGKFSSAQWVVPTSYPNWTYSISRKTKHTRTIRLTITNKSKARLTFEKDGVYLKNAVAVKTWDAMTEDERNRSSKEELKAKGIYRMSIGKKRVVKPGRRITLKYNTEDAVKYRRGGYVESSFRYNKKDYGVRHSYTHGESLWIYQ